MNSTNLSSLIWSTADDVLRGVFKPSEYGRIILPFVVFRRLDCVLEPKKDEILELQEKYKDLIQDTSPVIQSQIGLPFFNNSKFDFARLKSDPNNIRMSFDNYVHGFSRNVFDIIESFSVGPFVEKLEKHERLYMLIDKFTQIDLYPSSVDNHQMGTVYEELLRKFSEMSNEERGDHFTPRDIVKLLVSFVFGGAKEDLEGEGEIRSVYVPCYGPGGMLTIGKEWIHQKINESLKINLYGQELNDTTYANCKSDLLMLGENPEIIYGPCSSISDIVFRGRHLLHHYQSAVWVTGKKKDLGLRKLDTSGRFAVGTSEFR